MPTLKVIPKKSSKQNKSQRHKNTDKNLLRIKSGGTGQILDNISERKNQLKNLLISTTDYSQMLKSINELFIFLDFQNPLDYEILFLFMDHLLSNHTEIFNTLYNSEPNLYEFTIYQSSYESRLTDLIGNFKKNTLYLKDVKFPNISPDIIDRKTDLPKQYSQWIGNLFDIFGNIRIQTLPYNVWLKFSELSISQQKNFLYNDVNQWLLQGDATDLCIRDISNKSYRFDKNSSGYYSILPVETPNENPKCPDKNCKIYLPNIENPNEKFELEPQEMLEIFFFKMSKQLDYGVDRETPQTNDYFINPIYKPIIFIPNDLNNLTGAGNYYIRGECVKIAM